MKDWNIDMIQGMNEDEARAMALDTMQIKGHSVYFVDFGGYFKYSALVFAEGRHIYYANEYELHYTHMNYSRERLHKYFVKKLTGKLFTEDEITGAIRTYDEYRSKSNYLHNYYGMRREYVSIFGVNPSKSESESFKARTASMVYDPVCFAYYDDADFVRGQKGHAMDTMYIITRIMQSGPFSLDGFRYFLDFDGSNWIVKRAQLHPNGSYDAGQAAFVCNFTL